jgi:HemY protein
MIRLLVFVLVVLAAASGFAWLADRPGQMMILWQGQQIEMSLMVAVSLFVAAFVIVLLLWWLLRAVWRSPKAVTRYFRARKRDRGYQALSTGLIAAGAGNAILAARMAERTRGLLSADQEPLIHLLEAQTALIRGDHDAARRKFEAMVQDPETRELGLRGLHMEARRMGADEAAEHYARQAVEKAPYLPWASQAVLEYRTRAGDFDGALDLLAKQRASGTSGGRDVARERAVLLTARAASKLESDPKGARDDAQQALKLSPALVPAAVIAARAYFREDNLRKGSAVLEQIWKLEPHPEIADTYIHARSGDTALDRLKRAERLEALKPDNPIGLAATARAALDARQFEKARQKAEAALKRDPREGLLMLIADIEEMETGDQARVRHLLSMALRAPRDPAWVADGVISAEWQPISPVTGELGAFVWKPPVRQTEIPVLSLEDLPPPAPAKPEQVVVEHEMRLPEAPKDEPEPAEVQGPPAAAPVPREAAAKASEPATVVPFFGHPPDDPGVRKEAAPKAAPRRKPLF